MPELRSAIPVLSALDVPANTAFWVNTLGFGLLFSVDGFAGVARDAVTFYIGRAGDQALVDHTQAWVQVADVDALHALWSEILSADFGDVSGPAMTALGERPWGREFAVRDLAGNCVHFADAGQ